jgi:hypothetical protein
MLTPAKVREWGYVVRINHYRYIGNPKKAHNLASYYHIRAEKMQDLILPKGGMTSVEILDKDLNPLWSVTTKCSKKDVYSRKEAVRICMERLAPKLLIQGPF